jgi:hypothetical protein
MPSSPQSQIDTLEVVLMVHLVSYVYLVAILLGW